MKRQLESAGINFEELKKKRQAEKRVNHPLCQYALFHLAEKRVSFVHIHLFFAELGHLFLPKCKVQSSGTPDVPRLQGDIERSRVLARASREQATQERLLSFTPLTTCLTIHRR